SSPKTVMRWVREYERQGEDGLRPKQRGRPPGIRRDETDLERLQRENLYLRAEVDYLKKLKALRAQNQR
ncbi:helix-turn-helix domain-containing protein, partial [Rahnella sp. C60]|uniref:helix-turn-helix domain-containing protein n=1 Tax=Rahnella perminowiae TaxID=2816244 RepID=UPI001C26CD74